MVTKRESSFGETENKSKVDKHDTLRNDGIVTEPKFRSTLKDMIDDVSIHLHIRVWLLDNL